MGKECLDWWGYLVMCSCSALVRYCICSGICTNNSFEHLVLILSFLIILIFECLFASCLHGIAVGASIVDSVSLSKKRGYFYRCNCNLLFGRFFFKTLNKVDIIYSEYYIIELSQRSCRWIFFLILLCKKSNDGIPLKS